MSISKAKKTISLNFKFTTPLALILLILKLGGVAPVVNWSWWLVLLPFYIGPAIMFGIMGIGLAIWIAIIVAIALIDHRDYKKRRKLGRPF